MTRQQSNEKLVELLRVLVKNNPDLRFSQILSAYGFVERRPHAYDFEPIWSDEFYTEPEAILTRVNKAIEILKASD